MRGGREWCQWRHARELGKVQTIVEPMKPFIIHDINRLDSPITSKTKITAPS